MPDNNKPPPSTPENPEAPSKKKRARSVVPRASKERWSHWANIAKVVAAIIAALSLVVAWFQYKKGPQKAISQEIVGSNNVQGIIEGSNNQVGNNNRSQSSSFDNNTASNISGVNLGVQSNSGNSVSGNGKQIINGTDNSTVNNFVVSNINILLPQLTNVPAPVAPPPVNVPLQPEAANSPIPGGEWPALGVTLPVQITTDLPRGGCPGAHTFEFYQKVNQGDRLHFDVSGLNGAAMRTWIKMYEDGGNNFIEASKMDTGQHWTMTKGVPGTRVTVQIISQSLGTLNVRVAKAN